MTGPADAVLSAARADRDDAAEALRRHLCSPAYPPGDCRDCRSLAAHLNRAERQVTLLAAPGETGEMF